MTLRGALPLFLLGCLAACTLVLAACGSAATSATPTADALQDCPGDVAIARPGDLETRIAECATVAARRTPFPAPTRHNSPTPDMTAQTPSAASSMTPAGASGIEGQVLVGPTCPVERIDSPCPDRPYSVELAIYQGAARAPVATVTSDPEGRFHVELAPGLYTIMRAPCNTGSPACAFPRIASQEITVKPGVFTYVTVHGDTGIR